MINSATLGKNERLKSRKALDVLFQKGNRFTVSPIRVFWNKTEEPGIRVGVGVSAKHFKKAVDRNRIKRQLRESYRLQKSAVTTVATEKGLHIFFIYTDTVLPDFSMLKLKVEQAREKISAQLK
jgi:ribonuclease P protein component